MSNKTYPKYFIIPSYILNKRPTRSKIIPKIINLFDLNVKWNIFITKSVFVADSIDEGFEEIFSDSGDPPLFTNDEVQFFNQFMKNNINKNQ